MEIWVCWPGLLGKLSPWFSGQAILQHIVVGAGGERVPKQKQEKLRQAQSELWGYVCKCRGGGAPRDEAMGFGFAGYLTPPLSLPGASARGMVPALKD